jgi:hypothetical protein
LRPATALGYTAAMAAASTTANCRWLQAEEPPAQPGSRVVHVTALGGR